MIYDFVLHSDTLVLPERVCDGLENFGAYREHLWNEIASLAAAKAINPEQWNNTSESKLRGLVSYIQQLDAHLANLRAICIGIERTIK